MSRYCINVVYLGLYTFLKSTELLAFFLPVFFQTKSLQLEFVVAMLETSLYSLHYLKSDNFCYRLSQMSNTASAHKPLRRSSVESKLSVGRLSRQNSPNRCSKGTTPLNPTKRGRPSSHQKITPFSERPSSIKVSMISS